MQTLGLEKAASVVTAVTLSKDKHTMTTSPAQVSCPSSVARVRPTVAKTKVKSRLLA